MNTDLLQLREILADLAQGGTIVVQINGNNSIPALSIVALAMVATIYLSRRK